MKDLWEGIGFALMVIALLICAKSCHSKEPIIKITHGQTLIEVAKP